MLRLYPCLLLDIICHRLQPGRHLLFCLDQYLEQITTDVTVPIIIEGGRQSKVTDTPSASNAVHILFDITWKIKVDDMLYIRNVQAPSSNLKRVRGEERGEESGGGGGGMNDRMTDQYDCILYAT